MRLSLIIDAENRAKRPLERFRQDVSEAGRATTGAGIAIKSMGRHMDRAERSARGLGYASETMGNRIAAGARRGSMALVALERRMQLSHATMTSLAVKSAGFIGGAIRGGVLTAGAAGGALAAGGLYKIVSAGTQAEVLKTQLIQGRNGDVNAAEDDLKWIAKFAADTPYDLAEVTKAFIDARGAGVDPMNGSLKAMGDAASALGKTYSDAIGMIQDAAMGEFTRLPEFQIKAAKKGEQVSFRYFDRSGKAMVKTIKDQGHNIEQAITEILTEKFGGGMDAIAKTTSGKWATLTDSLSQQAVKVWDSGFGDAVKHQLDRATQAFKTAEEDGSADAWATRTGRALEGVVNRLGEANWEGFKEDLKGVAGAFEQLYEMADKASGAVTGFRKILGDIEVGADKYIGGLRWDTKQGGLRYDAPDWAKPKLTAPAKPSGIPWMGDSQQQVPALQRLRSAPVPFIGADRPAPARPAARPAAPAKGKLEISIKTDAGTTARPTKVAASDMDLEVNTGRRMGGYA